MKEQKVNTNQRKKSNKREGRTRQMEICVKSYEEEKVGQVLKGRKSKKKKGKKEKKR